jgi:hypothetical protein
VASVRFSPQLLFFRAQTRAALLCQPAPARDTVPIGDGL